MTDSDIKLTLAVVGTAVGAWGIIFAYLLSKIVMELREGNESLRMINAKIGKVGQEKVNRDNS